VGKLARLVGRLEVLVLRLVPGGHVVPPHLTPAPPGTF
jgi:hypothetical protein